MRVEIALDLSPARHTSIVSSMLRQGARFEPEVSALLLHLFRDSAEGLFIDVGSHIGYFPLVLAKYCEAAGVRVEVHAHEPLPRLQRVSKELQERNGVTYHLEATAVSDFSGAANFYVSAVSDSSGSLVPGFRIPRDVIHVEVRTLDGLYAERLARRPVSEFVLLIDVETGEPAVLRGARGVLQQHRPLIVCEVLAGRTEEQVVDALRGLRYAMYRFDGRAWVRDRRLVGDPTYRHRDWFFVPNERAAAFGDRFEVPEDVGVRVTFG